MDISIIIVNWNSRNYLLNCLESLYSWTKDIDFEVLVIDNASYDGSEIALSQNFPNVRFIQNNVNQGFARANNLAFKYSEGEYILFLNPDTLLIEPAVQILLKYAKTIPNLGALGCKLLNEDRSLQTTSTQAFPTILGQMLNFDLIQRVFPKAKLWGLASIYSEEQQAVKAEVISGAALMVKRTVFEEIGLFSDEYFMYAEDLDLCYKMFNAGYQNYYIPSISIIHFGGGSTAKKPSEFSVIMMRESILCYMKKFRGDWYGVLYRTTTFLSAFLRLIILLLINLINQYKLIIEPESIKYSMKKWFALLAWSLGFKNHTIIKPN